MSIPAPPPEHLPFLHAIVNDPDDDLPRLVFADFLEESGVALHIARAHFIRAQIELEKLPPLSAEAGETRVLIERLTETFLENFHFELPIWLLREGEVVYRRGFPNCISLGADRLAAQGAGLFDLFPITGIRLTHGSGIEEACSGWLTRLPYLSRVHSLGFTSTFYPLAIHHGVDDDGFGTPFFHELMTTPVLHRLKSLSFRGNRITDAFLVRFVSLLDRAAFARSLTELDFTDCLLIGDPGANTLATARNLEGLTRLTLKNVQLSDDSRAMLRRRFGERVNC